MLSDYFKTSRTYLIIMILIGSAFFLFSKILGDYIIKIDEYFIEIVSSRIVNNDLTKFMKIVTNLGGVMFFSVFLIIMLLFLANKRIGYLMSINLVIAYIFSVVYKSVFRRSRPLVMLIDRPYDYSFPSGHTMCSVVFYGFLLFVSNRYIKNVNIRRVINIILIFIMILIPFSRLYLGVHYFSDIIAGVILGVVCLLSFVNYVKIKELL